jgi:S1-C subfamily serine protease
MADSGTSYEATVVGSDPTEDVAVLTIDPTSDLEPAEVADDDAAVGDAVTAVGNSEGGGVLQAADGTVTALDASLTTAAEGPTESESLSGMIEVDADIVSGDSGGALLDADGDVVGINTAASQGSADVTGYAIPIDRALDVAQDILDGVQTDTNTLGYPAFLGVALTSQQPSTPAYGSSLRERGEDQSSGSTAGGLDPNAGAGGSDEAGTGSDSTGTASTGATVGGVYEDTPAATIGLAAGDTITGVDGTQVTDGEQLAELLDDYEPGDQASITWVDASGSSHSAEVTLTEGPAA